MGNWFENMEHMDIHVERRTQTCSRFYLNCSACFLTPAHTIANVSTFTYMFAQFWSVLQRLLPAPNHPEATNISLGF